MRYKKGFTLAEILITLGIIGVVAAMTIPTLIANTRSQQYRSKFKKAISTLSQAARLNQSQYDFDYAGITQKCGDDASAETPENKTSICAIFNANLTGAAYYKNVTDIPMIKKNNNQNYELYTPYIDMVSPLTEMSAYVLADGTIVAFYNSLGVHTCTLAVGTTLKDYADSDMGGCFGFIDVNGTTPPNKEVSCSTGSNSLAQNTCIVKNDAKHMTDIFPIRFHDGIAEPATAAGRYVLKTSK